MPGMTIDTFSLSGPASSTKGMLAKIKINFGCPYRDRCFILKSYREWGWLSFSGNFLIDCWAGGA